MTIDELLETPYWIVDILPERVSADSPGQYFAVEEYFLQDEQMRAIKRRHLNLILKMNCYRALSLDEDGALNPPPEQIAEAVLHRYTCIRIGDSLLVSEPDDLSMTLYHPDEELLSLVKTLCAGDGLFLWQPPDGAGSAGQGGTA